ncbi:hypothetical protein BFP72_08360 [Reichenbachiella sp. 5M10]|uniref:hypothetical protein n=1 Tax=Reichenbachiella sp. 5M10 TaxID=1889772 RepID=UPI000C161E00|nr:hypothetical protein [Reichenbachiella sp. 5M10]PIB35406.1 hypothetical protein BFP72_08360 [Reichenbachiella sp. 5M10]
MDSPPLHLIIPIDFSTATVTALRLAHQWSLAYPLQVSMIHPYRLISSIQGQHTTGQEIKSQIESDCFKKFGKLEAQLDFTIPHAWELKLEPGFLQHIIGHMTIPSSEHSVLLYPIRMQHADGDTETIESLIYSTDIPILMIHEEYDSAFAPKAPHTQCINPLRQQDCFPQDFIVQLIQKPHTLAMVYDQDKASKQFIDFLDSISPNMANFN